MNDHHRNTKDTEPFNIDSLILKKHIGSGSFGKVYIVEEKKTKQIYAAKISKQAIYENSEQQNLDLSREVNIISKLDHPSVLKFIGFSPINFKKKPKPVIVTEFASNGSLGDLIALVRDSKSNNNFSPTSKLIIIYGIASAMSYLHLHNIIHRDLKPDNILLDDFLLPKIADFGLSKIIQNDQENQNSIGGFKGTPIYMSPEIWNNSKYSEKSDVYAFCLMLYEIVTNNTIFESFNFYSILANISKGYRPTFNKLIPQIYKDLIEKCWAQDPNDRPTFNEILNQLKNDRNFLTDSIDEKEYLKHVAFFDEYKATFDEYGIEIDIKSQIFDKISLNSDEENKFRKIIENENQLNTNICPFKFFIRLNEKAKQIVIEANNDPIKQFIVGVSMVEGCANFPLNTQVGINYLKNSLKEGCVESLIYYCNLLIKGKYIPKNHQKVKKLLDNHIQDQEEICNLLYGKHFQNENNFFEAKKFFERSIELGNGEANYELGKMIYSEEKDEAIEYFKNAIDCGCTKSMLKYGLILMEEGKSKDGIRYIKMAAENGNRKALLKYSSILEKGECIQIDQEEAKECLKKAASKGCIEAMHKYSLQNIDYEKDKELKRECVILLKKACDRGNIDSIYNYGLMLSNGKGVQRNIEKFHLIKNKR